MLSETLAAMLRIFKERHSTANETVFLDGSPPKSS
jgi:hypothetical protein